jgi:hypothetical protein
VLTVGVNVVLGWVPKLVILMSISTFCRSTFCHSTFCHLTFSHSTFWTWTQNVAPFFRCSEFSVYDQYRIKIFEENFDRPEECAQADPDNPLCQMLGKYSLRIDSQPGDHFMSLNQGQNVFGQIIILCMTYIGQDFIVKLHMYGMHT